MAPFIGSVVTVKVQTLQLSNLFFFLMLIPNNASLSIVISIRYSKL